MAAILGIVLLLLGFTRWHGPILSIYYLCFAVLTMIFPEIEDAPGWKLYRVLYVLLVVVAIVHTVQDVKASRFTRNQIRWAPYVAALAALCLSAIYTPAGALDVWDASGGLVGRIVVIGLYWIAVTHFREEKDLRHFIRATVLCGLIMSLWVIQNAWRSGFAASRGGLSVNQTFVVEFIAIGMIPLIDLYFVSKETVVKVLAQLGILISMYGAYLTGSRGATLGLVLAGTVMVWKYRQTFSKARIARAIAGVVLFCGIAFILPGNENVLQRFLNQGGRPGDIDATEARTVVIWPLLLDKLSDRNSQQWLIGEGLNSSSSLLHDTFGNLGWGDAHNMYLQAVYDQGLIGLGLFLFFLYCVAKRIPRAPSPYVSLFYGWFVCLLVEGMFEVEANNKPFWILLGVMAGSYAFRAGKALHVSGYVKDVTESKGPISGVRPLHAGCCSALDAENGGAAKNSLIL